MEKLVEVVKGSYQPSCWAKTYSEIEMHFLSVPAYSAEYRKVVDEIHCTLSKSVQCIKRIQNPYLWGCYLLRKAEYECRSVCFSEKTLYHETSESNVDSIAKNNFNWRLSGRRAKYGAGVSFSHSAQYAHKNSSHGGAMLVARVLVGNTERGYWHQELPSEDKDTTSSSGGNYACDVYVKFSDNEFYPEYIVYFD